MTKPPQLENNENSLDFSKTSAAYRDTYKSVNTQGSEVKRLAEESKFRDDIDPFDDMVGSGNPNAAFTPADARLRTGNYIIPFGLPGSGKTTFLASFFKYIDESPHLNSEIVNFERNKVPNFAGQAMMTEWQRVFNSGKFLDATQIGELGIRELTYNVQPNIGQKTQFNFSVIEVSGEDLVKVIAESGRDPKLPAAVEEVFKNKRIRVSIVLVVHPNQLENDLLFNNLFSWLRRNVKMRLQTFSLMIIIANPELALKRLHKRRPDTKGQDDLSRNKLALIYLQEFAPKTFSMYNGWAQKKRSISPFYVGDIETTETEDASIERIVRFDNKDARQIFKWMYHQFTGKSLGRTMLQKIIKKMSG